MPFTMPGADYRPLEPTQRQSRMSAHDIVCIHTMVGSLGGTDNYFKQNGWGGTESHLGTGHDGTLYQWQDFSYRAEANYQGNHRVFSIENADRGAGFPSWDSGDPSQVPAFTAAQIEINAKILAFLTDKANHAGCPSTWKCRQEGIPLALIPDSKPTRRGIGYHRQGCPPGVVEGGEKWSTSYGKVCPGRRRIAQIPQIIERAKALRAPVDLGTVDMRLPVLSLGSKGPMVGHVQRALGITADDEFGPVTMQAVGDFQVRQGWRRGDRVGGDTYRALGFGVKV